MHLIEAALPGADESRGDDEAIGQAAQLPRVLGRADAEAQHQGHVRLRPQTRNIIGQISRQVFARASDAGQRDDIDEAGRIRRRLVDALVIAGGRQEKDQRHALARAAIGE